ncbi:MAG: hypothetical protein H7210_02320 [Pyrinomonadaceae bacterium]|nr:hypothetical protein [Phycisphaerales bacterium]
MFRCPYCNLEFEDGQRTDEHFIPKCIGGSHMIPACKKCNDYLGSKVDCVLSQHPSISLNCLLVRPPDRSDRHPAVANLKDGRQLQGISYFESIEDGFKVSFEPRGIQFDGKEWVHERFVRKGVTRPTFH